MYGEKGGIEWHQMEPNTLITKWLNKPMQILRTGGEGLYPESSESARIPAGHPEGYFGSVCHYL